MKLLCFQAKRFWWRTQSKSLSKVPDRNVETEVQDGLIVFFHAEPLDEEPSRKNSLLRHILKHIKWLAHKRCLKNVVLHSFAHLGGEDASPAFAEALLNEIAERLRKADFHVWLTPFGYLCEWDLNVHGDSLAKVWKEL